MNEAGWEIATHGYKWIDYRDTPRRGRSARTSPRRSRIHTEVAGARPLGFYQGRSSINTIPLGCEEGGFLYCADTYADDLPYWIEGPQGAAAHRALHARLQRHALCDAAGVQFRRSVLRLSQGFLRHALCRGRDGAEDAVDRAALPAGRPARPRRLAGALPRLCRAATTRSGSRRGSTSRATGSAKHPPPGGWKPSRLTRTLFVERFGGVYEHSPLGRRGGLSTRARRRAPTRAAGLAAAMARAMAAGSEAQKRALIDAHPDLAGKLALAKTPDRGIDRASRRAPGSISLTRRRTRALHRAQRRLSRAASASPSSWR